MSNIKVLEYKDRSDHISYLRQKWAVEASEWFVGENGSLRNLKEVFGYSDDECYFTWSSIMNNQAWDVPNIKDATGAVFKENYAPELMIKYIAHTLQCHIIVFDLQLGNSQFCSANYLKADNVAFNSPLLSYSTGNHLQSVLPIDHRMFSDLALRLQNESLEDNFKDPKSRSHSQKEVYGRNETSKTNVGMNLTLEDLRCMKNETEARTKKEQNNRRQKSRKL